MSEYQTYEFQTLDRLLTDPEQQAVKALSSHIEVTPSRAVVAYHWGSFRHDPREVTARYFDAFMYTANWGRRRLIFRFPKALLEPAAMELYCIGDGVLLNEVGHYMLLEIEWSEEGGWRHAEGTLSSLVQLRQDILEGDYRVLYLAWLMAARRVGLDAADTEPPVPAGLQELTPALSSFITFFEMDPYLVQGAAQASPAPRAPIPAEAFQHAIGRLPPEESRAYLWRLAQGEAGLSIAFRHRLLALVQPEASHPAPQRRRTLAEIEQTADLLRQAEARRQAEAAEQHRLEELARLAQRESHVWREVATLVQRGQAKGYDEAVAQLVQLRELAEFQHTQAAFQKRVRQLAEQYRGRYSFLERLQQAGLA